MRSWLFSCLLYTSLDSLRKSAATEFSLALETQLAEINAKLDELGYTEEVVRKSVTESLLITKAEDYRCV